MSIDSIYRQVAYIQKNFFIVQSTEAGRQSIYNLFVEAAFCAIPFDDKLLIYTLKDRVTLGNLNIFAQILERNRICVEMNASSSNCWQESKKTSETKRCCIEPKKTNEEPHFYSPQPSFIYVQKDQHKLESASPNISITPIRYTEKINPEIAEKTAQILGIDGFIKDKKRDYKHVKVEGKDFNIAFSCQNDRTVGEVQGDSDLCKLVIQLTEHTPSVLSPAHLRNQESVNKTLCYLYRLKRIGHAFSIDTTIDIDGKQFSTIGFNETFVFPMLRDTFNKFAFLRTDLVSKKMYDLIDGSLSRAIWHDNATITKINEVYQLIHNPSQPYPAVIGLGWVWHSMWAVFDGDFIYCDNRGADSKGKPGINILKMKNKKNITREFIKRITSRLQVEYSQYTSLEKIKIELGAVEVDYIPMKSQKTGICVYHSEKAKYHTLFLIALARQSLDMKAKTRQATAHPFNRNIKEKSKSTYKELNKFDKEILIEDFLIDLKNPSTNDDHSKAINTIAASVRGWLENQKGKNKIHEELWQEAYRLTAQSHADDLIDIIDIL